MLRPPLFSRSTYTQSLTVDFLVPCDVCEKLEELSLLLPSWCAKSKQEEAFGGSIRCLASTARPTWGKACRMPALNKVQPRNNLDACA